MRYLLAASISLILLFSSCVKDRVLPKQTVNIGTRTLIHYWNFNGSSTTTPTYTIGGGNLSFDFTTVNDTTGYADLYTPTIVIPNLNAQNGDTVGNLLRVRNPCIDFIITAPTTGYQNIILSYSIAKSNNGASTDSVYYSTDGGVTYTNAGISPVSYSPQADPAYVLESFDFSSITAVNNNAGFKFKIVFSQGNLATSGNSRIDNITVDGDAIGGNTGSIPVISSPAAASGYVNSAFTYTITASNSPASYDVTGLPAGLSINASTGVISGTPTATGTFTDTLKAINSKGTGTEVLTLTINPPAVVALLHYWNFNSDANTQDPSSVISGGVLSFDFATVRDTTGYFDYKTSTANSQNAQNNDPDGDALRVRNPVTDFIITAPTTNYKNIVVSYAVEASSTTNAPLTNTISYTTDGATYTQAGLATVSYDLTNYIDPLYVLESFDFSSTPAVNNNPNFKVKITFANGNLNTAGNDRFDNLTVEGVHD